MSPPGSGKPLFDLIPRSTHPDDAPVSRPTADAGRIEPHSPRGAASGRVAVPVTWLYVAAAAALLLLVLAYGLGYRVGAAAEREEIGRFAPRESQQTRIEDPLTDDPSPKQDPGAKPSPGSATGAGARNPAPGTIVTAAGLVPVDPRIEGSNYLELATLPRDQAEAAVRYLASQGEEAIAVPVNGVDRRGSRPNTSDRYRVIALGLAVPGDRYSSSTAERERFERRLARLGKAWADQGGASDFSDPLWRRFGG
ncbi:MAG: hypothetical protein H6810_02975 [Phycisphaeraceae bacterium]|nr:MAG: hypothetical protein H6810_02975 [Phycisphaeraceae bacterium]